MKDEIVFKDHMEAFIPKLSGSLSISSLSPKFSDGDINGRVNVIPVPHGTKLGWLFLAFQGIRVMQNAFLVAEF